MPFPTDRPSPRRGFAVVAILVLLAALAFAPGSIASASDGPETDFGGQVVTAGDAGHTPATVDAYRRSDLAPWPQPPPSAVVVAVLVAGGVRRSRSANPGAVPPSMPRWHPAWDSRGPPRLILV